MKYGLKCLKCWKQEASTEALSHNQQLCSRCWLALRREGALPTPTPPDVLTVIRERLVP